MKNILILCTGNSCRSQMAHGYLNFFTKGNVTIYSAGIEIHGLNLGAVKTMELDGIDISQHTSNHVDEYKDVDFDFIITVCDHANENCPYIPSKNAIRLHHNFEDPSKVIGTQDEVDDAFLKTRNEIKTYCLSKHVVSFGYLSIHEYLNIHGYLNIFSPLLESKHKVLLCCIHRES